MNGTKDANTSVPRTSLMLLLSVGILISLVFTITGLARLVVTNLQSNVHAILILIIILSICLGLSILLFWLSNKLYPKGKISYDRLLLRRKQDDHNGIIGVDTNQALDYLKNESKEEKDSAELLENALSLWSIEIKECLIPRNEIIGVEINDNIEDIKTAFIESKHSKLIVYENDMDNILGYVHHSDFYVEQSNLQELVRDIPTVPESMTAIEMLSFFKKNQKSIAWVVDEFGGTAGILTTEDLLEELFGEIEDEHDESEYIEQQISTNEFILSGRLEVEYVNDKFELEIPTESAETLSGYIIEVHNEIPEKDEKIIIDHYEYKILQVSKTRIETIRLKVLEV